MGCGASCTAPPPTGAGSAPGAPPPAPGPPLATPHIGGPPPEDVQRRFPAVCAPGSWCCGPEAAEAALGPAPATAAEGPGPLEPIPQFSLQQPEPEPEPEPGPGPAVAGDAPTQSPPADGVPCPDRIKLSDMFFVALEEFRLRRFVCGVHLIADSLAHLPPAVRNRSIAAAQELAQRRLRLSAAVFDEAFAADAGREAQWRAAVAAVAAGDAAAAPGLFRASLLRRNAGLQSFVSDASVWLWVEHYAAQARVPVPQPPLEVWPLPPCPAPARGRPSVTSGDSRRPPTARERVFWDPHPPPGPKGQQRTRPPRSRGQRVR